MSVQGAKTAKGKLKAKETTQVLTVENLGRKALFVCNPSAKEVWLALGPTAGKEEGIWLKKESGCVLIPGNGNEGYTGPVSCITTSGEGEITFSEV